MRHDNAYICDDSYIWTACMMLNLDVEKISLAVVNKEHLQIWIRVPVRTTLPQYILISLLSFKGFSHFSVDACKIHRLVNELPSRRRGLSHVSHGDHDKDCSSGTLVVAPQNSVVHFAVCTIHVQVLTQLLIRKFKTHD